MKKRKCSHCGEPMKGMASISQDGETHWLCHPDFGMDCYRLVTVRGHLLGGVCNCRRIKKLTYRWFEPGGLKGEFTKPFIEITVHYDPLTHDPQRTQWHLNHALGAMVAAIAKEDAAHGDGQRNTDT